MAREVRTIGLPEREVRFANGTTLEAPAFAGEITQWSGQGRGVRSPMLPAERDLSPQFEAALAETGIRVQETLHVDLQAETASVRRGTRAAAAEDQLVLHPAAPSADGHVQVVLYQDESGGMTWHFADDHFAVRAATRKRSRSMTFTIPARTAEARQAFFGAQPAARLRGPVAKLGRKILKVLLVPVSKLLADPVREIVGKMERSKRQDLIRGITAANYRRHVSDAFTGWSALHRKRGLLIVHGIFSTTEGMLSGLPPAAIDALLTRYKGRVIALDQLTVTKDPERNARDFLEAAAASGKELELDILCHSRGGIVARTLAERGRALVPEANVSFPSIFFAATPNAGSPLGNAEHIVDMLDIFTNFTTNFPDGPALYSLEVLLAIVKLLAYTAVAELPGIATMGTEGYIKRTLNAARTPSAAVYAAVAAHYEPDPNADNAFFNGRFSNAVIDRVFERAANDLVVPRDGVFAANGHPSFPIADPLVYGGDDHVWHTDYFRRPHTIEKLLPFFSAGVPVIEVAAAKGEKLPLEVNLDTLVSRPLRHPLSIDVLADDLLFGAPSGFSGAGPMRIRERRKSGGGSAMYGGRSSGPSRRRNDPPKPRAPRSSSQPLPPATLERTPAVDFHELVNEGETLPLVVSLNDVVTSGAAGNLMIDLLADEPEVTLMVSLTAPGFNVKARPEKKMTVRRERDPRKETVTFTVTARNPGAGIKTRELIAEFWLRNTSIGSVKHYTNVVPKDYAGPVSGDGRSKSEPFVLSTMPREDCDLVIVVEGEDESGCPPFRLRVRNTMDAEAVEALSFGKVRLPGNDLSTYVSTTIAAAIATTDGTFIGSIHNLGKQLWTFLPKTFRDYYFTRMSGPNPPRSIRIHSDEMIFPWELVVPHDSSTGTYRELPPLGIAHVIGRWKPGTPMRPSPQRIRGEQFVIIRPEYPAGDELRWAKVEEVALRKLLSKAEVLTPANAAGITALLKRTDVRFVHFSGHGTYNAVNADLSSLELENGTSMNVTGFVNNPLSATAHPIVYLNACELGAAGMTVGRAGGFAAACIESGYSGLIASYWAVNDESAARLSVALYQKLLAGMAIGEALRELRANNANDPAFAAAAYYGDPWTRIDLTVLTTRVASAKRARPQPGA